MASLEISKLAARDLAAIADCTDARYGIEQARNYRDGLEACFSSLCANRNLGRNADELVVGLRRITQGSHVIFYMPQASGNDGEADKVQSILIVRGSHSCMDFVRSF